VLLYGGYIYVLVCIVRRTLACFPCYRCIKLVRENGCLRMPCNRKSLCDEKSTQRPIKTFTVRVIRFRRDFPYTRDKTLSFYTLRARGFLLWPRRKRLRCTLVLLVYAYYARRKSELISKTPRIHCKDSNLRSRLGTRIHVLRVNGIDTAYTGVRFEIMNKCAV